MRARVTRSCSRCSVWVTGKRGAGFAYWRLQTTGSVFPGFETTAADWAVAGVLAVSTIVSLLRVLALVMNYGAPVEAFAYISSQVHTGKAAPTNLQRASYVCAGGLR